MFLRLDPPIVNASGILSYPEVFVLLERRGAAFGGYITKSVGPVEKGGNENPVVFSPAPGGGPVLNSLALPTQSPEDWVRDLEGLSLKAPLIVSVYGGDAEEFAGVLERLEPYGAAFELNLGCPNKVPGEVTIMESIGQSPALSAQVVAACRGRTEKPLVAKLSPNADYLAVAEAALGAGADALGCGNTLGPGLAIDIRTRRAVLAGFTGGISGPSLKPINLRMVYEAYRRFRVPIVAYGGIESWRDGVEYLLAGASVLGVGTACMGKSTDEIVRLSRELWDGVQAYLDGAPLSALIGAAHA
ncbi:MAG: hypothetical protein ACE5JJ_07575 [Nitrospinota bacterium]